MSFGQLVWELIPAHRSIIRRVEQIKKKIVNAEAAANFNQICLHEDLLPIYTNIYIYITTEPGGITRVLVLHKKQ